MNDALGNKLVIEVEDLLAQHEVFDQGRAARAALQAVLIVADRNAVIGGQNRPITNCLLMGFTAATGVRLRSSAMRFLHRREVSGNRLTPLRFFRVPRRGQKLNFRLDANQTCPWRHTLILSRTANFVVMIDLNTATAEELDSVPELKGHSFEIVRYREERGRFEALRQLDEVPGLSGKWDGAETHVRVG